MPVQRLRPYWLEIEDSAVHGFGVTAYSLDDAFALLEAAGLRVDRSTARVREVISVDELDPNHVSPNMGLIMTRGVWYPNLNSTGEAERSK